ncbi:MAG: alpha-L-fucosidase [Clostridia bacterium]|nr:alpha-L-fucosidase [Clostridia bacterium]
MSKLQIKPKQLEFMDWEFGVFFHFGIRTFHEGHKDWDMKPMELSAFHPTELDCENWIATAKEAGAKYALLVCKHHDGFANWPSAYTDYSVKNTPWKDGKGDVVREFTDACRKHGMKVGLYYSPAQFGSKQMEGGEYDDYFINQISELLTGYGRIDYLWLDGCGSENHKYDAPRIVREIRRMQPDVLIFDMWDPDVRWGCNEAGVAPMPNRNVINELEIPNQVKNDPPLDRVMFLPVECDFRMRLKNWFYSEHDEDTVKSVAELMGLYEYSVGRGANMLLNIGPDRRGLLPEKDAARLLEFGEEIRRRYGEPLKTVKNPEKQINRYVVDLEEYTLIDRVVLKEDISEGEKITDARISVVPTLSGTPVLVHHTMSVGHKLIATFPPVRTRHIHVEIEGRSDAVLTEISIIAAKEK